VDGGHCPDLLDLRFQGNAVLRLLVCRDPHVAQCGRGDGTGGTENWPS
jgi:hypothetical protein